MKTIFTVIVILVFAVCFVAGYSHGENEEIKTKNEIIEIDSQLILKHERELELYGDFIVAIVRGDDRSERLMREDALEAGEKMIEIKKEIEELIRKRGDLE